MSVTVESFKILFKDTFFFFKIKNKINGKIVETEVKWIKFKIQRPMHARSVSWDKGLCMNGRFLGTKAYACSVSLLRQRPIHERSVSWDKGLCMNGQSPGTKAYT